MKLKPDNDFFVLVDYIRDPKFCIGTVLIHEKLGIFRVTQTQNNNYIMRVVVFFEDRIKKGRNKPFKAKFNEIENNTQFKEYEGSSEDLRRLVLDNLKTLAEDAKK